jgi:acetoin utilization deacetylase AcuC-like enzyme
MTTLLYTHQACLDHDPGRYHPESPDRLRAVLEALDAPEFARLDRREAPEASLDDIARVHPRRFVERMLAAVPASGHAGIDAHRSDPLAQLLLDEADYSWVTEELVGVARRHAGGRVVATLEGGYDLAALGASAAAHVRVLMSV